MDEEAAYLMVTDLKPVTRRLTGLAADDLRATLRRLCLRVIPVGSRPAMDDAP